MQANLCVYVCHCTSVQYNRIQCIQLFDLKVVVSC